MDIQATKLEALKYILDNDNTEFLQRLSAFINIEKSDIWTDLNPVQQDEIKQGIDQLARGKRIDYKAFLKKVQ